MAEGEVWFGTKDYMRWIACPAVDINASKVGFANSAAFLSGGAWVRRSKTAARTYSLSWNMRSYEDVRPVLDYADGIYGNGYIYYVDPFAASQNVLPPYWAAPYMNFYDGPVIVNDTRPTLITNGTVTNGYPIESAQYTVTSTSKIPSVFIPIPTGYTLHVGAHGSLQSGNATVTVTPAISAIANGTTANLTLLTPANTTRTNYTLASTGVIGATISLKSTSTGVIQIDGMIAQLRPTGETVPTGGFISGMGASGMSFASQPQVNQYSAAMDLVGVSADLIETEAWAWQ